MRRFIGYGYGISKNEQIMPIFENAHASVQESVDCPLTYEDLYDSKFNKYVDNLCEIAFSAYYAGFPIYIKILDSVSEFGEKFGFTVPVYDMFHEPSFTPPQVVRKRILSLLGYLDRNSYRTRWTYQDKIKSVRLLVKTDDFPADVDVKRFFDKMPGSISIFKDDESDNKECVMLSPQSIENSVTASKIANMFSNLDKYKKGRSIFSIFR